MPDPSEVVQNAVRELRARCYDLIGNRCCGDCPACAAADALEASAGRTDTERLLDEIEQYARAAYAEAAIRGSDGRSALNHIVNTCRAARTPTPAEGNR